MGISQFKFVESEVNPQVVAAIIAAVLQYDQEGEVIEEKPYVLQKNRGWKNLCLQENCWGLSRFRY